MIFGAANNGTTSEMFMPPAIQYSVCVVLLIINAISTGQWMMMMMLLLLLLLR